MHRILAQLKAGAYPNCHTLAEEIGVSWRTVFRDIEFMRDQMALPIGYDAKKRGYYLTQPVAELPPLQISEAELVAVLITEKAMAEYRGTPFEHSLRSAFAKLTAQLSDKISVAAEALDAAISFRLTGVAATDLTVFESISKAVTSQTEIEFDYRGLNDKRALRRRVEPYHLAHIDHQWYLLAWDLERQAERTFVISRISNPAPSKKKFLARTDFSAQKLLAGSFGVFYSKKHHLIRIQFDPFAARLICERDWHPSQKTKPLAGGEIELHLKLNTLQEVERWVLSWGTHAKVLAPPELKRSIQRTIAQMAARR